MSLIASARARLAPLVETGKRLADNRVIEMAAALAFYSALSLAPLVVITLGVAGVLADRQVLERHMIMEADAVLGRGTADLVRKLAQQEAADGSGLVATTAGLITLLLGATAVFGQLQDGLTRIFEGPRRKPSGVWAVLRRRLISLAGVVSLGFLLIVSLVMSAVLSALAERVTVSDAEAVAGVVAHVVASLLVSTLMFTLLFRVMPDERISWREAWGGGALTAVLFQVGEWAIGTYLGRASVGSPYGAAGTLVVMLVWVYYSSIIVFASAQFTHVLALRRRARRKATPPNGRKGQRATARHVQHAAS